MKLQALQSNPMLTKCAPHEFLPCISGVSRVHSLAQLSESSDVYSFGVFLLELITGREAAGLVPPESKDTFAQLVSTVYNKSLISKVNHEKFSPNLDGHVWTMKLMILPD